ncbi:unnamed protein product [Rhizophagus irregularis]|uniref:Uncharacterized protein n=1 Tax=Rhizophagus irregularis TaxID=588596 RepID=A0A915ZW27_9GLOM|nr:unnamed protein product [Rhizophagus irregularis]CAB5389433.1 unnamed protein product [Rhizophagus irregularis]
MIKSKNINFFLASTGDNAFLSQSCDRIAKAQGNVLHWAKKNKRALITVDTNYCENITLDTVPTFQPPLIKDKEQSKVLMI